MVSGSIIIGCLFGNKRHDMWHLRSERDVIRPEFNGQLASHSSNFLKKLKVSWISIQIKWCRSISGQKYNLNLLAWLWFLKKLKLSKSKLKFPNMKIKNF